MLHSPPSYTWPSSCTVPIYGTILSCTFPFPLLLLSLSTTDPHRQLQGKTYDWAKRIHFKLCMAWCVWRRGGGDEGWNLNETKPSHRYPFFCRGYRTSLLDTAVGFSKTTSSNECETCKEAISTCPRKFCSTTLLHTIAFAALPCLMHPLFYPSIFLTLFLPTQFLTTAVDINRNWVDPYPLTLKQILQAKCRKSGFLMTKIKVKDHMHWCSRCRHTLRRFTSCVQIQLRKDGGEI